MTDKTAQELSKNISSFNMTMKEVLKNSPKGSQNSNQPLQSVGTSDGTSRFLKKEDPTKKFYKDSVVTLKEILKVNKEMLKNSIQKLSGGLGSLLALGGLLGFLLTGKKELLFATLKGLEKAFVLPMAKLFDKFVMTAAKTMLKEGGNILRGFGGLAKSVLGLGKKGTKAATKAGEEIALKEGAKIAEKVGLKGLIKGGGKLGLKALSKIPILGVILGPVVGIMFAIQRWKKGDYVGALMEVGSGLVSMIPGIGIPISLAIDVFMAFRDIKSTPQTIKKQNDKKIGNKKISDSILDSLPVIGTIRAINRMKSKWAKKDFMGALKEAGSGIGSLVPGLNMGIDLIKGIMESFKSQGEGIGGNVGDFDTPTTSSLAQLSAMGPMTNTNKPMPDVSMVKNSDMNPFSLGANVRLQGMKPNVLERFLKMGQDFFALTGKKIPVNSAYRSYEEQKALYKKFKAQGKERYAANPDDVLGRPRKTPHMIGIAADIAPEAADALEKSGLLEKYGFHRPLMEKSGQPRGINEPWHIQSSIDHVGDANVSNPSAIDMQTFMSNMEKLNSTKKSDGLRELIEVTKQNNKLLIKTIENQKIVSKQSISVNSAG